MIKIKQNKIEICLIILTILIGIFFFIDYNYLQTLKKDIVNERNVVEENYQKKTELIPEIINYAKTNIPKEKDLLNALDKSYEKIKNSKTVTERSAANDEFIHILNSFYVIIQNYKNIKDNNSIKEIENRMDKADREVKQSFNKYNSYVEKFNKTRNSFPSIIVAYITNIKEEEYYQNLEKKVTIPKFKEK